MIIKLNKNAFQYLAYRPRVIQKGIVATRFHSGKWAVLLRLKGLLVQDCFSGLKYGNSFSRKLSFPFVSDTVQELPETDDTGESRKGSRGKITQIEGRHLVG